MDVWPAATATAWLLDEGRRCADFTALTKGLAGRLVDDGLPLWRLGLNVVGLHPEVRATSTTWYRGGEVVHDGWPHSTQTLEDLKTPLINTVRTGEAWRCRLDDPAADAYPLLVDFRARGATDYVCQPLRFASDGVSTVTWTTDHAAGFSDAQLVLIEAVTRALSPVAEVIALRQQQAALLETYLGRDPARAVLGGAVRRGEVRHIDAAVMLTDLRGYTSKADAWDEASLLRALDLYFEAIVDAVTAAGGEVLKFLGDGVLALFPITERACAGVGSHRAVRAVGAARRVLAASNAERAANGLETLQFGTALHVGPVAYGNVGGTARLDFTALGPTVNLASRVEEYTKVLDQPVLATGAVAAHVGAAARGVGAHPIRGLAEPVELFAIDVDALPPYPAANARMIGAAPSSVK